MFVSGRHDGRRIIVDVTVVGKATIGSSDFSPDFDIFNLAPLKALIDTGATSSSIAPETVLRLGLISEEKRDIRTASGWHRTRVYGFLMGIIPDANSAPYVLPTPILGAELVFHGSPFDILLGMDAISQGDLTIRRDGVWSFEF